MTNMISRLYWTLCFYPYLLATILNMAYNNKNGKLLHVPNDIPTGVRSIDLFNNTILTLDDNVFSPYTGLQKLYLSDNKLSHINKLAFQGLTMLSLIDLQHNLLTVFPDLDTISASLTTLQLEYNDIMSVDISYVTDLQHLHYLDIDDNKISGTFKLPTLAKLKSLDMDHNMITMLPDNIFHGMTSLEFIDFDSNEIVDFPNMSYLGCPLTTIIFSNNKIQFIDPSYLMGLSCLKYFDISSNEIQGVFTFPTLPAMKIFNIKQNDITNIDVDAFNGMTNLKILRINRNHLTSLPNFTHIGTSLSKLHLDYNDLESLDVAVFEGLSNLKYLDLSHNDIVSINISYFIDLHNLKYLNIDDNNISGTFNLPTLAKLKSLDMDHNKITMLPGNIFYGMTSLQYIDFDSNEIVDFPNMNHIGCSLKRIEFSYNKIRFIDPSCLMGLSCLENFDISANEIQGVFTFPTLPAMKIFKVNWNNITNIDVDAFNGMTNLMNLEIAGNCLTSLPNFTHIGTSLTTLRLDYNHLESLDLAVFEGLTNLKYLDLSHNQLLGTFIPPKIPSLTKFEIDDNDIDNIPVQAFMDMNNLQYIKMNKNKLTSIINISLIGSSLITISLAENNIRSINLQYLTGLSSLSTLDISKNDITDILQVPYLPSLELLYMQNNPLNGVNDTIFNNLPKIKSVDLRMCGLTKIPHFGTSGMMNLVTVDLSDNLITTLKWSQFQYLNNGIIKMKNNPIVCDSSLCWLKGRTLPFQIEGIACTEPPSLNGMAWEAVNTTTLSCLGTLIHFH